MNREQYQAHLKTDHWQQVRLLALEAAGHRCQVCNSPDQLDVHHRTYERLGHEDLSDLTVLCGTCHGIFHESRSEESSYVTVDEALLGLGNRIKAVYVEGKTDAITTGLLDLDEKLGGLFPRELVIVAARASVGKTAFLMHLARDAVLEQGRAALVCSLEQSRIELCQRIAVAEARVNSFKLRKGEARSGDLEKIETAAARLLGKPLFFQDSPNLTLEGIVANARKLKAEKDLAIVLIDYLQLIRPRRRFSTREQEVGYVSRALRWLANDVQVPVVACAQLNRASEGRESNRPRLSDLRESGSIEAEADVVLLLHRQEMYEPGQMPGSVDVAIAKHRNGPTGEVLLTFLKEFGRFENFAVSSPFGPDI